MTALPPDSAVYRHLWSTDEVRALLDDTGRTQRWLDRLSTPAVVLSSGSYTSSVATLSSGSAAITIPAGSLATGALWLNGHTSWQISQPNTCRPMPARSSSGMEPRFSMVR